MTDSTSKPTRRAWHWALKRRPVSFLVVLGLVALWCTVSWAWWLQSIPLLPTWTIPLAGRHIFPPSPVMDRLVLVRQRQEGNRTRWTGPLDFYEPTNGRFLKTVLTDRDEILVAHSWGWDAAVIRRDQEVHLVDLQTGSSRAVLDINLSKRTWGEPAFLDEGADRSPQRRRNAARFLDGHRSQTMDDPRRLRLEWRTPDFTLEVHPLSPDEGQQQENSSGGGRTDW